MVRLNLQGVWIDFNDFDIEIKWKHPIKNSLKGDSSTYSTDITAPLSENNRLAFDYKIFGDSTKTNKYLYGYLYINGTAMRVRCYIVSFSSTDVVFYLEQYMKEGGVSKLITDATDGVNICDLYAPEIRNNLLRDVQLNVSNGQKYNLLYPDGIDEIENIFHVVSTPYVDANGVWHGIYPDNTGRPSVYADERLLPKLAEKYNLVLVNAPTNYYVYANQWKVKNGEICETGDGYFVFPLQNSGDGVNIYVDNSNKIISSAPFFMQMKVRKSDGGAVDVYLSKVYAINENGDEFLLKKIQLSYNEVLLNAVIPAGTYHIVARNVNGNEFTQSGVLNNCVFRVNYEKVNPPQSNIDDAVDFGVTGYYCCWQNLPQVSAKELIETIALCSGKLVNYTDTQIIFTDFAKVFDWKNAIDVSDKLIKWNTKKFRFLESNNATVSYASGQIIATVKVNDSTLPNEQNDVATIDAIRIQDDTAAERVKDKVVLQQTPDGHFEIINKLASIYTPCINARVFEAEFIYFEQTKSPLLVRQLGGVFIAIESIITTKNTVVLTLLKLDTTINFD